MYQINAKPIRWYPWVVGSFAATLLANSLAPAARLANANAAIDVYRASLDLADVVRFDESVFIIACRLETVVASFPASETSHYQGLEDTAERFTGLAEDLFDRVLGLRQVG